MKERDKYKQFSSNALEWTIADNMFLTFLEFSLQSFGSNDPIASYKLQTSLQSINDRYYKRAKYCI